MLIKTAAASVKCAEAVFQRVAGRRRFGKEILSPPVAAMPAPSATAPEPTSAHPNCAVPGPDRPPATEPHPASAAPIPVTRHPVEIGAGGHRHHFHLWRRWSLRHGDVRWRCIGVDWRSRCGQVIRCGRLLRRINSLSRIGGPILVIWHINHSALDAARSKSKEAHH